MTILENCCVCVCFPFFIAGALVILVFFSGPTVYFATSRGIFGTAEIFEKYDCEGIALRGSVVKRWMTSGTDKTPPGYRIRVLYHASPTEGAEEAYVKDLTVANASAQSQAYHDVVVLPEYPRSAIAPKRIQYECSGDEGQGSFLQILGMLLSLIWACALYSVLILAVLRTEWPVIGTVLVACEFIFAWIVGYFLARARRNHALRGLLFGAKLSDSTSTRDKIPDLDYVEFFPLSANTFWNVIRSMITDYAKFVGFILKFILGILIFIYFIALGGGYCLMMHFLYYPKMRRLFAEEYKIRGEEIVGKVVNSTSLWLTIQYDVADNSSPSSRQRYEVMLQIPRIPAKGKCCGGLESILGEENPRLVVLPEIPTSARLWDEIEVHERILRRSNRITVVAGIISFSLQTTYAAFVIGRLAFPNVPTWNVALVYVALQLVSGIAGAFTYSRYMLHQILYNAKQKQPVS